MLAYAATAETYSATSMQGTSPTSRGAWQARTGGVCRHGLTSPDPSAPAASRNPVQVQDYQLQTAPTQTHPVDECLHVRQAFFAITRQNFKTPPILRNAITP